MHFFSSLTDGVLLKRSQLDCRHVGPRQHVQTYSAPTHIERCSQTEHIECSQSILICKLVPTWVQTGSLNLFNLKSWNIFYASLVPHRRLSIYFHFFLIQLWWCLHLLRVYNRQECSSAFSLTVTCQPYCLPAVTIIGLLLNHNRV